MGNMYESISDLTLIIIAVIFGVSWIVVTYLKSQHIHVWESIGDPKRRDGTGPDRKPYTYFSQHVRCTECGYNTWQKAG